MIFYAAQFYFRFGIRRISVVMLVTIFNPFRIIKMIATVNSGLRRMISDKEIMWCEGYI